MPGPTTSAGVTIRITSAASATFRRLIAGRSKIAAASITASMTKARSAETCMPEISR